MFCARLCVCDIPWLATTRCWIRTSAASLSRRQCLSCQSRWCSPDLSGTDHANGLVGLTLDFPASQRVLCSPLCDTPWLQPASTRCWIQTSNASSASSACLVSVMHSFLALTMVVWYFGFSDLGACCARLYVIFRDYSLLVPVAGFKHQMHLLQAVLVLSQWCIPFWHWPWWFGTLDFFLTFPTLWRSFNVFPCRVFWARLYCDIPWQGMLHGTHDRKLVTS